MSNPETPETQTSPEPTENFGDILSQFQKDHSRKAEGGKQLEATVISVTAESVFFDIGYKSEGILPLAALQGQPIKPGDKALVTVKGRDLDGYYELSRFKVEPDGLVGAGKSVCRQDICAGNCDGRDQGRIQRGRGSAGVHAGFARRSARRRRHGEAGGAGNSLPDH
jgi:small subunit ribosomal protein S1